MGINGRHRALLLFRHLDIIPMLLVKPDQWPPGKLKEIMQSELQEGDFVSLPNLPIRE